MGSAWSSTCAADDSRGQSVVKPVGVANGIHPLPHLQIRAAPQRDGVQPLLRISKAHSEWSAGHAAARVAATLQGRYGRTQHSRMCEHGGELEMQVQDQR